MKFIFYIFWKAWFYILATIIIVLLSPLLFILTANEKWYAQFYWVTRNMWAKPMLYAMGFFPRIEHSQPFEKKQSYVFVANHTSVTDIMLMYVCSKKPFVFVGKKELAKTPIFGYFYKRVSILVDRADLQSRKQVYTTAYQKLQDGLSVCIFPEGGVPDEDILLDNFKDGAFRLAITLQIPIVPMTFFDNKKRFPFRFFAGSIGEMRVKINPFIETKSLTLEDKNELKEKVRTLIINQLSGFDIKNKSCP